jgi:tetratricopeptide (TPR) repeat protein
MARETASPDSGIESHPALALLSKHKLPVVVFSVAFLVRLIYLITYSRSPFFQVHIADALFHDEWAQRILGGDIFSLKMPGVLYKAPLYPYFLAFGYLLSGKSSFLPMLLQVVMTAVSCLILFLLGKRYFGARAGLVGALIYCFYFPSIYFAAEMEIPAVAIFLTLLSFHLVTMAHRALFVALSALVFGLSLLAVPTNGLLMPLYLGVLLQRQGPTRRRARKGLLFVLLVLTTVAPSTLRNLIAGDRLTLISANGGINFYIGNNERYDDTVYLQPGYAFEDLYDEPRRLGGVDSFADRDRYWYGKAFAFIRAHPGREAALVLKKLVLYFADYEILRNTDTYYAKAHSVFRSVPFVPASWILATGLVGLCLTIRRRVVWELGAFCALLALPCLIFFVTDRYRLPSMCVWALFSGAFVTSLAEMLKTRHWPTGVALLTGAACLAAVSNLNLFVVKNPEYRPHLNLGFIHETEKRYDQALAEYSTALDLAQRAHPRDSKTESELHARRGNVKMMSQQLEAARADFLQALEVNPRSGPAYSYLGTLYEKERRGDLAVQMFKRAIEINPWDVVSIHNLGLAYLNSGRLDEAIAQLNRTLELAPEHAAAHNNLAYIYGTQGKRDRMEAEVKKAIFYDPDGTSARYNLASLYLDTGRTEEAIAQYRAITERAPREAGNAYNQLGVLCAEKGDLKQAIENWQKALEIDPHDPNALANMERAKAMLR